jgi:hypothetical protein
MKRGFALVALAVVCVASAFADATFRQVMEVKFNVPIGVVQGATPFPGLSGPTEIVARVKGTRAYSGFGQAASIMDSATDRITLLDMAGKRYATASTVEYLAQITQAASAPTGQMPEEARQILQNIEFKIESRDTGRSEKIQGIDAGETEILFTMTIPLPMPMPGGNGDGLEIRGKFHLWKPKPGETERVPALREISSYYEQSRKTGNDTASLITRLLAGLPGIGEKVNALVEEVRKGGGVALRFQGELSVPGLAALLQQAKAGGANVPTIPDGPLFEFNSSVKEMNTDAVPDSVFQVPEGYRQAPLADVIKAFLPGGAAAR